ncbi:hypothetical protein RND81_12G225000 [Saponaria officinalis]|uniref:DEAD/DEAH-box helicase domain-containing protein n=1 Tax=Saponaria officinalis TaxID=3572 RepID=A0AAW1HE74_SAPOF
MVKGDDVKAKKKNKKLRKKLNRDPSTAVSTRVAAIIAAKKRRHTGKRRQCQGMCFSLPTPEDPFNDRRGKEDTTMKKGKKPRPLSYNTVAAKDESEKQFGKSPSSDREILGNRKAKGLKQMELLVNQGKKKNAEMGKGNKKINSKNSSSGDLGWPSNFLIKCLNSMRDLLVFDGQIEEQEESFVPYSWGFEFWKSYSLGRDILENSGTSPSVQQIAWITSTAADSITRKESEVTSLLNSPFLLYLVPSQEKAVKVRSLCKPLKPFGIHTVCLHAGSSVEHQITGLKKCDPEFVVATPERLWELVTLKEFDISSVALLVVDAMDSLSNCLDTVKCIRDSISGNARTVVFQGSGSGFSSQAVQLQSIIREPVDTLSVDDTKGCWRLSH